MEIFMNKKEVFEIRKQFSPANCGITKICGCYVDYEKNVKFQTKDAFLSLPEDEAHKYFELFKKTLSGAIGKNLLNMEFPLGEELEGGAADFLYRLRNSKLEDEDLLNAFYQKVIEHYQYEENYYIVLIHGVYDIPGKGLDGVEMFDASDNVYEYILMSVCPVSLSKAGLSYNPEVNCIQGRIRDWLVELPDLGFLYPAFNDRNQDIHQVLCYSRKPEQLQRDFIKEVFGVENPITAMLEKDVFETMIAESLGEERNFATLRNVYEELNDAIEEHKDNPEPLVLGKREMKILLEKSGANQLQTEEFEQGYDSIAHEIPVFQATNIINTKKFEINSPNVIIKVNPDRTDLIETKVIDGRKCLVIAVDDSVEVNGVLVNTI